MQTLAKPLYYVIIFVAMFLATACQKSTSNTNNDSTNQEKKTVITTNLPLRKLVWVSALESSFSELQKTCNKQIELASQNPDNPIFLRMKPTQKYVISH